ncbi:MAG: cupredoxin domain-containing protein [Acidimicrobiia bacterium]|nr:cupredoxin domain-containing protein [Acidimicrobiia bacterium]
MTETMDGTAASDRITENWLKLARGAAIAMVVWAIVTHITARVIIPPVLVIGLIFAAFIPFLRDGRRRVALGLAVFSFLALAGNVPALVDELTHLSSAPAFILTLLSLLGAVTAIVGGIGAFRSRSEPPTRRVVSVAAAVFVVLAATSIGVAANTDSDVAQAGDVEILAEKVKFNPEDITVSVGGGIWIDNKDGIRHTFTIEGEGVDLEIPALKAKRLDLDLAAGTYDVICGVPGHENMTGTLVVEN